MDDPCTAVPKRDVLASIRTIVKDDYFDAIEVKMFADDDIRKAARRILEQSHMKVCYGAQPRLLGSGLNPNAIDEAERLKAEKALLEAIDEAEYLGAGGIAFLAGRWEQETKELAYEQLLKTTRCLCGYAAQKGMAVELEVFDYDMDKAALRPMRRGLRRICAPPIIISGCWWICPIFRPPMRTVGL